MGVNNTLHEANLKRRVEKIPDRESRLLSNLTARSSWEIRNRVLLVMENWASSFPFYRPEDRG
jgi:hypothetical protein